MPTNTTRVPTTLPPFPPLPQVSPYEYVRPVVSHENASINGHGLMFWNQVGMTMLVGFGSSAAVSGSNADTTLICIGKGDITFLAGDGFNNAKGSIGNDTFVGGAGINRFDGGAGNDNLVGGDGYNDLYGGKGNDTIVFGQWDTAAGGSGADRFTVIEKASEYPMNGAFTRIQDFSARAGDTLDLTMLNIGHTDLSVNDDTLVCYTPDGILNIDGVGHQITLVGGVDNAILNGVLDVSWFGDKG